MKDTCALLVVLLYARFARAAHALSLVAAGAPREVSGLPDYCHPAVPADRELGLNWMFPSERSDWLEAILSIRRGLQVVVDGLGGCADSGVHGSVWWRFGYAVEQVHHEWKDILEHLMLAHQRRVQAWTRR